jgi:hypothetical protein
MLFGGHLILDEQMTIVSLFGAVDGTFAAKGTTRRDPALSHAMKLGWLFAHGSQTAPHASDSLDDFRIEFSTSMIQVEEILHYASPFMEISTWYKIVCFPTPRCW